MHRPVAAHDVLIGVRLHIPHLPRKSQRQVLLGRRLLQCHALRRPGHRRLGRRFQDARRLHCPERAVRPLPHRPVLLVRHQPGAAQVVRVDRVETSIPVHAHRNRAVTRRQPDVFASARAHCRAVVIVTQQGIRRQHTVTKHVRRANTRRDLALRKLPLLTHLITRSTSATARVPWSPRRAPTCWPSPAPRDRLAPCADGAASPHASNH